MNRRLHISTRSLLLIMAIGVGTSGCAPKITPLYRDFERADAAPTAPGETVERLERALHAAGWTSEKGVTPNIVGTAPRQFREWGLYGVEVSLEASAISGPYVRMFVHPYRTFFWGARRKVPYLRRSLARSVFQDLNAALEAEGLINVGSAVERDRAGRN